MSKNTGKVNTAFAELKRKAIVTLKRNPHFLPLSTLLIGFLVYSLNLTDISNTTAKLQGQGMGLCSFVTMLFSMLSFLCMINAFPKRQKPNLFMILIMFVLFGCMIYADYSYIERIIYATTRPDNPIKITQSTSYITSAQTVMALHMLLIAITGVFVILEPLFAKIIRKINTSIEVEGNGEMASIELTEE
jgi:hypothetical protein